MEIDIPADLFNYATAQTSTTEEDFIWGLIEAHRERAEQQNGRADEGKAPVEIELPAATQQRLLKIAKSLNLTIEECIRAAVQHQLDRDFGPRANLESAQEQSIAFMALLASYLRDDTTPDTTKAQREKINCGLAFLQAHVEHDLNAACQGADAVLEAHLHRRYLSNQSRNIIA